MEGTNEVHKTSAIVNSRLQLWLIPNALRKSDSMILKDSFPTENFKQPKQFSLSWISQQAGSLQEELLLSVTEILGKHGMIPPVSDD